VGVGEVGGVPRHLAEVHRLRLRDAHAREIQKLRQQSRQAVGLAHHERGERLLVLGCLRKTRELLDGAPD
jgi:hypothetical protein